MKNLIKKIFASLGLLGVIREFIYRMTRFIPNSRHPRRRFLRFYSQFVRKGSLCFDVGANVGDRTRIFLELGATVVSIEPQKACVDALRRSFGENERVVIVAKALSNREGEGEMAVCEDLPVISSLSEEWLTQSRFSKQYGYQWKKKEKVALTTLDRLIKLYGMPDFCKIDVEGYEEMVLSGLTAAVQTISFEFNREFMEKAKSSARLIERLGDYRFNYSLGEPVKLESADWMAADRIFERLESSQDLLLWGDIYARRAI